MKTAEENKDLPQITEVTIKEIADKFGIEPMYLRIKP